MVCRALFSHHSETMGTLSESLHTDHALMLWSVDNWRCELHGSDHLRLCRGTAVIAEHVAKWPESVAEYAEIWRAALTDVAAHDGALLYTDGGHEPPHV